MICTVLKERKSLSYSSLFLKKCATDILILRQVRKINISSFEIQCFIQKRHDYTFKHIVQMYCHQFEYKYEVTKASLRFVLCYKNNLLLFL